MAQLVRDLHGRPRFYLDAAADVGRDANGKPVASRSGSDGEERKLARLAATWMAGRDERAVLMDLGIADVVTQTTQAEFGLADSEFVADVASPVRFVKHDRGYFYLENVADALELVVADASATGQPSEINPGYGKTPFTTVAYSVAAKLPRQLVDNADFDLKARAVRRLVRALCLHREYRVATLLTTAGTYATANQVAAGAKWNGGTNPSPLTDLFSALKASAYPANTLILPENVAPFFYFLSGTGAQVRDFVQGGGQLPRIVYARARYTVSGANQYIWAPMTPANVALVRSADPSTDVPSSATFRWLANPADGERVDGVLVRQFFVSEDDTHWIVCTHNDVEVQVSNQIGALITGALQ